MKRSPQTDPESRSQAVRPAPVSGRKIVFFAAHSAFLSTIIEHLSKDNDVRLMERPTEERVTRMCAWADLAWFEWCDDLLIAATRRPRQCPIVCRLHSYEVFTSQPAQVDWTKVDQLIFVNQSVADLFARQVECRTPRAVIFNGVDTERYRPPASKTPTKRIASVGYINYKKNPALLLYCFKKIHEYDPRYTLHIAGEFQDSRYQLYFEHFLRRHPLPVVFHGWVNNMPAWYADKDYVMSTSLFESFHYSVAEGMACGVAPLIHDWYGADALYPEEYLFGDPDSCLELLRRLEKEDRPSLMERNRRHIVERFGVDNSNRALAGLLGQVLERSRARNEVRV